MRHKKAAWVSVAPYLFSKKDTTRQDRVRGGVNIYVTFAWNETFKVGICAIWEEGDDMNLSQ